MNFLKKIISILVLLAICYQAAASETPIVLDAENHYQLPRKFRITSTMRNLHLIGSAQFSEQNLKYVIDHYSKPEYIFDLRQESHGFLNGLGISWYGKNNWENIDKNLTQITNTENQLLKGLKNKDQINIFKVKPDKDPIKIKPLMIENEQQLANQLKIHYVRIPVLDHRSPSNDEIDNFVKIVRQIPNTKLLYFHCRGGKGRTTTFMAMVDMMRNAKQLSLQQILSRQQEIGGQELLNSSPTKKFYQYALERRQLLEDFYNYCHQNKDGFKSSWNQWKKL